MGNSRPSLLDIYKLNQAYSCPNVYENQCIGGQLFENESNGTIAFEDGVCRFAPFNVLDIDKQTLLVFFPNRWDVSAPPKLNAFIRVTIRDLDVRTEAHNKYI